MRSNLRFYKVIKAHQKWSATYHRQHRAQNGYRHTRDIVRLHPWSGRFALLALLIALLRLSDHRPDVIDADDVGNEGECW